jgi:hypothetical protein
MQRPDAVIPLNAVDPDDEGVYVLTNDEGTKYYVGHSTQHDARIAMHLRGAGAECAVGLTKRSPLLTKGPLGQYRERIELLENMLRYGIDNARGSIFSTTSIDRQLAFKLICDDHGLCFICGSDSHFTDKCSGGRFSGWGRGFKICGHCGCDGHFRQSCTAAP